MLGTLSRKTNVPMNTLNMIVKTENAPTNFATRGTESYVKMDYNASLIPKTNVNLNMTNIIKQTKMLKNLNYFLKHDHYI